MLAYIGLALGRFPRGAGWRELAVHSRWVWARGGRSALQMGAVGCAHAAASHLQAAGSGWQTVWPTSLFRVPPLPRRAALGLGGVLIVAAAVASALGLCAWLGLKATLIVMEVIPFLALAGGWVASVGGGGEAPAQGPRPACTSSPTTCPACPIRPTTHPTPTNPHLTTMHRSGGRQYDDTGCRPGPAARAPPGGAPPGPGPGGGGALHHAGGCARPGARGREGGRDL